jgi:hypothetical protein
MQKVMMLIVFFFSLLSVDAQPSPIAVAEKSAYRMVEATEVQQIIKVLEENICNPSWLATPEWQALAAEFQSEEMLALPLDEFQRAFNRKGKNTTIYAPFSAPDQSQNNRYPREKHHPTVSAKSVKCPNSTTDRPCICIRRPPLWQNWYNRSKRRGTKT